MASQNVPPFNTIPTSKQAHTIERLTMTNPNSLTYEITWHSTLPGVSHLRNSCFELSATAGQPTPGYSSGGTYVVSSGFWSAAPTSALDEIYFNGFEGCGS